MKRFIAWDTSSKAGSLVTAEWDPADPKTQGPKIVQSLSLDVNAQHSERLLWAIDQLLDQSHWTLSELDFIGVGLGPGSFTGLRIGITTAKTLAHVTGKPLVGVSSLACLARGLAQHWGDESVVIAALTDACKGEIFSVIGDSKKLRDCVVMADGDHPGIWARGVTEDVLSPEDVVAVIQKKIAAQKTKKKWAVVGEAFDRYPEIGQALPAESRLTHAVIPSVIPEVLARVVWEAHQFQLMRQPLELRPRYLRASDAEVKRLKAEKNLKSAKEQA